MLRSKLVCRRDGRNVAGGMPPASRKSGRLKPERQAAAAGEEIEQTRGSARQQTRDLLTDGPSTHRLPARCGKAERESGFEEFCERRLNTPQMCRLNFPQVS